ncbi:MAG: UDP-N-acetylglucosamine 2-epimerase [Phycisphaerae bacterium]|nr:UDP-N-acetylglucosamine 2-epimerase [Phycisphaerae bacterium]MDD5239937.1 UDP-N-acetylglucosamine 2-epimerase [Candidatus Nanoarchaeia archaeon]
MKKITVVTTSRADWGYLYWLCRDIGVSDKLELQIMAPTNHPHVRDMLDEFKFGHVFPIEAIKSIDDYGNVFKNCKTTLEYCKPDVFLCLGDRFETHAATTAALLLNIPIAHIAGGETTIGAFDNELRNSITQMATYHFTATEEYADNVAKMLRQCSADFESCCNPRYYTYGDEKDKENIFDIGSTSLDWLTRAKLLSKQELQQHVLIDLNQPFVVACMHSETKELEYVTARAFNFIEALNDLGEQVLLISPNIDPGNKVIRQITEATMFNFADSSTPCKIHIIDNLDHLVYLSLLQYAEFMIGNSSSGIIESASFNIPSVSVGNRQQGRIRNSNTFDCLCETQAILDAVDRAREWNALVGKCDNVYGDGHSTERIMEVLETLWCNT